MPKFTRPDFSDYVVHFTKDEEPKTAKSLTAMARLYKILTESCAKASQMPSTVRGADAAGSRSGRRGPYRCYASILAVRTRGVAEAWPP